MARASVMVFLAAALLGACTASTSLSREERRALELERIRRSACYEEKYEALNDICKDFVLDLNLEMEPTTVTTQGITNVCTNPCWSAVVTMWENLAKEGCTKSSVETPAYFQSLADLQQDVVCPRPGSGSNRCWSVGLTSGFLQLPESAPQATCQEIKDTGCCLASFSVGQKDIEEIYPSVFELFFDAAPKLRQFCSANYGIGLDLDNGCVSARPATTPFGSKSPASALWSSVSAVMILAASLVAFLLL